jgi:hypothetical protein
MRRHFTVCAHTELKGKKQIRTAVILLLCNLQNYHLNNICTFFPRSTHTFYFRLKITVVGVALASHVSRARHVVINVVGIKKCGAEVASNGMTFIHSCVKIGQVVQKGG